MTERWYKCKGCGQPIGIFPDGRPPYFPPGSVGHAKPTNKATIPNSVPCELFRRCSAQQLIDLHAGAEEIEPPTDFAPVRL